MLVRSMKYGLTTLSLHAEDCHLLAEACERALENSAIGVTEADVLHLEAMGAAFRAASVAGEMQMEMPMGEVVAYG